MKQRFVSHVSGFQYLNSTDLFIFYRVLTNLFLIHNFLKKILIVVFFTCNLSFKITYMFLPINYKCFFNMILTSIEIIILI